MKTTTLLIAALLMTMMTVALVPPANAEEIVIAAFIDAPPPLWVESCVHPVVCVYIYINNGESTTCILTEHPDPSRDPVTAVSIDVRCFLPGS